ncbi:MAG: hypothetical protein B6D56_02910 [Candidatus Omnitrophica bacterium 4484_70.1]|nr:MAG: hypothetical protein B6D56_02910 [Candidatus Omnitrophica bacterium 4484_70.1]
MFIGYCKINIFLPESLSLKKKRQVILGIKDRMRSFVCVNYTRRCVEEQISKVEEYLRFQGKFHIIDCEKQVF